MRTNGKRLAKRKMSVRLAFAFADARLVIVNQRENVDLQHFCNTFS